MKLRIRGNTLRFRLGRSEVDALVAGECVAEQVCFGDGPDQTMAYSVEGGSGAPAVGYEPGVIRVRLTGDHLAVLREGVEEGIRFEVPAGQDRTLQVAVERDFQCLKPRPGEDESDAYAHPAPGESC